MDVEVFLTGASVGPEDVRGKTAVVIDVFRASTTIITALEQGARSVIPVADGAEAGKIAANLDPASYLLGGERAAERIEGYHLGNSPSEYSANVVGGKTVILHTTNGTGAIVRSAEAEEVIIAGLLNATAVADRVREAGRDVAVVCAGWMNRVSLEDTVCAGLILDRLWGDSTPESLADGAYIALSLYRRDRNDIARPLGYCTHARRLRRLGFADDIAACLQVDTTSTVPTFDESRVEAARSNG